MLSRLRNANLQRWLGGYLRHRGRRAFAPSPPGVRHLLFALCDHYEPLWGHAEDRVGEQRVDRWRREYKQLFSPFRDADGRMPQHSWFFPGEEYRPVFLDALADLAGQGCGEVELHLHHDRDTESSLRSRILEYLAVFTQHGHLSRDPDGRPRYAFIHGNWALANGRPDGRWCGVDAELPLLFETGCFADFTFPSCPDVTQPAMVNCIYWPCGDLRRARSYEGGELARVGRHHEDRILIVTGPLTLTLRPKTLRPRLEFGESRAMDPPSPERVRSWVAQEIHVAGRPEWIFVKTHAHAAPDAEAASLLGPGGLTLHKTLCEHYNDGGRWKLHYVTAREMFNIARAAMDGKDGDPNAYRDYLVAPPPTRR
jgi:hypothetical protein